jgi:hypothetical protein
VNASFENKGEECVTVTDPFPVKQRHEDRMVVPGRATIIVRKPEFKIHLLCLYMHEESDFLFLNLLPIKWG